MLENEYDQWQEIKELYQKASYWFYQKGKLDRAENFTTKLTELISLADPENKTILGESCRALLAETQENWNEAIKYREHELELIKQFGYPNEGYTHNDMSDRLELLAICYKENGDLEKAIDLLKQSQEICIKNKLHFEGKQLLKDYQLIAGEIV